MNLSWIDWTIMIVAVVSLRFVSISTRKYMRGVADFLAANRCAGRYLLTIASAMGGIGVVTIVGGFEVLDSAGTAASWWGNFGVPVAIVIVLTGWVYYRFRETRALTMAQFFEMRYSKKFRINAGILCWISGVVNFGIFPGVAARFFIYYCGLPEHFHIASLPYDISTFATVMFVDLALALSFVLMGGQISVMVTECVQGMFCTIAFIVIIAAIMIQFSYGDMMHALQMASTPGASRINPFDTSKIADFNIWYYLIGIYATFYSQLSWQGSAGFNSSARTPHEQKMGQIIAGWRGLPQGIAISLLGLAAIVVLRLPEYADKAAIINAALAKIPNESVKGQMILPVAMAHVLPIGIKGLFGTIMLFISFTCHDTYMHSWGSIFIQDVYMPIKNKVLSPAEHIKLLRWSILFVAFFSFVFSLWYVPNQKIYMFFAATGTIWLGGSGAVIIGGLYWKRGTTAAAYAALFCGAALGFLSVMLPNLWERFYQILHTPHGMVQELPKLSKLLYLQFHANLAPILPDKCPINSQVLFFIAMVLSLTIYVTVSIITGRGQKVYNISKMLHRGEYADEQSHIVDEYSGNRWMKLVGINSDFSKTDRFLAIFLVSWNLLNFVWFLIWSGINLLYPITDNGWILNNWVGLVISLGMSIPCAVWFTIGGIIDIKALFKHLETCERDDTDDGRVLRAVDKPLAESTDATKIIE